ncbi:MAG: dihydroxyacetone kinase subunit L [Planctomycetes bacterium]|nr:dihydroxyacetone kinase subunit L [Planctomycetota bacterium]
MRHAGPGSEMIDPQMGVDRAALIRMLRGAAAQVRANHETLSRLDSFGGDGDHGTTMLRAIECMERVIADPGARGWKAILGDVGWALLGVDGGATGPLFGSFFLGMAEAAEERDAVDAGALAGIFEAGLAALRKRTKAQVGDKTMIDALVPAVAAMRQAVEGGADPAKALGQAAEAALRGAESTKAFPARFGRAKNVGEKSVGHADPGATTVSLVFRGFAEGIEAHA